METVIGLLIVLLPVIFKLIGKRLEQAGQDGSAKPPQPLEGGIIDVEAWIKEAVDEEEAEEEQYVRPVYEPLRKPVVSPVEKPEKVSVEEKVTRQTPVRKPVQKVKDEPVRTNEKIDPKKLIVYSEIMTPKYKE